MLTFLIADVRKVIARGIADALAKGGFSDPHLGLSERDNRKPGLWLVGDHGVYLCSNGKLAEGQKPLVSYAEECNPHVNNDWWDIKRATFGGDDGVDFLSATSLEALFAGTPDGTHLRIAFMMESMQLFVVRKD